MQPITVRVAAKGGLSVYGLGRFPVTLYAEQWEHLLKNLDVIREGLQTLPGLTRKTALPGNHAATE